MLNYLILSVLVNVVWGKPNIVVVITDDQDDALNGMAPMQNVHRLIGNEGITFKNSYTASPVCCPARASFLTGMHLHNHNTKNNSISGGCYGYRWQKRYEKQTFATVLKDAGYDTFYAGKYLNQYGTKEGGGPEKVPPGWTEWRGLVGNSKYYNYTLSNNGVPTFSETDYLTDVIKDLAVSFIENQTESRPFLMVVAPPAPHAPFTPAPRHRRAFDNVTALRRPNFNVVAEGKHWLMRMPPSPLPEDFLPHLDEVYRNRWETLLAVDEMVGDIVSALEKASFLDNTYLIYTSDNGYHVGQFSQVYDKRQPYESDIKVPLIIKGPNLPKNQTNDQPILNIDLAPTIIDLAGLDVPKNMDGRPINFENTGVFERNMLIEYYGEGSDDRVDASCPWKYDSKNLAECYPEYDCKCQDSRNNTYACLRHIAERIDKKYCLWADAESFTEMYDLSSDPYELTNIVDEVLPAIKHYYKYTLVNMLSCSGAENCDNPLGDAEMENVQGNMKKERTVKKKKCLLS